MSCWLAEIGLLRESVRQGDPASAMPLHLERIEWMPSPPLAPDDGPIDFEHLKRMTLGDAALEQEVLAMFSAQSAKLVDTLAAMPADAGALAHTLKGSARAIGAFAVADAAARLEAAMARGSDPSDCARRTRRGGCAGAGGDRGGSAPFLSGTRSDIGQNPGKMPPQGFRPDRWRCADRPVIGLPGPFLTYSGSTSDHGQNPLCRPFRRKTNH